MAAFGIPQAHEDDAERAIRAALAIIDSVAELGLEARIGVESGEVVVDSVESTFATGEAVNVAARLQQAGEPNTILIGPGAHRLTLGCFEVEDEGPIEARGITDPVWTYRVTGVTSTEATRRFAAPLVGREAELELLQNTYSRAVRDRRAHCSRSSATRESERAGWRESSSRGSSRPRSSSAARCPTARV